MENVPEIRLVTKIKSLTMNELKQQLDLLAIHTKADKKGDVWEIYQQNFDKLKHYDLLNKSEAKLWNTRNGLTNMYCKALLVAGKDGLLMKDVMKAAWNEKKQTFYDRTKALIAKGIVKKEGDRFFVTQKGLENSPC